MKNLINNDLQISYPEGFRELDRDEILKMNPVKDAPGWCIRDDERHNDGIEYHYTAQENEMYARSLSVKNGKNFYYIHFYGRQALKAESDAVFEEILKSASWK